jgi:hypothetical protein
MCDVVRDMDLDPRDQRIAELEAENLLLKKKLAEAMARIEEIEKAAHRQAGPFRREEKKKVPPQDRKKPGRKPGHEGFSARLLRRSTGRLTCRWIVVRCAAEV